MTNIKKSFTFTEMDQQMLDELKTKSNFVSEIEVVRHALRLAHKKEFPYYKQIVEAKDEDYKAREELKKLPIEQYVKQILDGDMASKPGFCVLKHKANPALTISIPINLVKNYASRNEVWQSVNHPLETE